MISVQRQDFDVSAMLDRLRLKDDGSLNTHIGGICTFVGTVRDMAGEDGIKNGIEAMTLEHYPGMTEQALHAIEAQAHARWSLEGSLIIHRYGTLALGEKIVLVMVASRHRQAAFEACNFLMDWLKTKAPFWKKEHTAKGDKWVQAKEADAIATARWSS